MFTPVVRRVIVAAVAGVTTIGLAAGPAAAATKPVTRLAGTDRIGTSIAISTHEFPTAHTAARLNAGKRSMITSMKGISSSLPSLHRTRCTKSQGEPGETSSTMATSS